MSETVVPAVPDARVRSVVWREQLDAELSEEYFRRRADEAVRTARRLSGLAALLSGGSVLALVAALGASEWLLGLLGATLTLAVTCINTFSYIRHYDMNAKHFDEARNRWAKQASRWSVLWTRLQCGQEVAFADVERQLRASRMNEAEDIHVADRKLMTECQLIVLRRHGVAPTSQLAARAKSYQLEHLRQLPGH